MFVCQFTHPFQTIHLTLMNDQEYIYSRYDAVPEFLYMDYSTCVQYVRNPLPQSISPVKSTHCDNHVILISKAYMSLACNKI